MPNVPRIKPLGPVFFWAKLEKDGTFSYKVTGKDKLDHRMRAFPNYWSAEKVLQCNRKNFPDIVILKASEVTIANKEEELKNDPKPPTKFPRKLKTRLEHL